MGASFDLNNRPPYDKLVEQIADYVCDAVIDSDEAYKTAHYCLLDTLGCGFLALEYPACRALMGPIVAGTVVPNGVPVAATSHVLDPVKAAFDIGCMVRWLDYNDTWLAAEWGHPSDNLGAILACTDFMNRQGKAAYTVRDLLTYMIKAHEIQGVLALTHSFNRVGLDHVLLVKVASTAVAAHILGGDKQQVKDAITHAWIDGQSLRTYRHAPNTGSRKSWAAGDATSRAVMLSLRVLAGEMGYPSVLTAPTWGFQDVSFKSKPIELAQPLGSYVMENILFKISYPAEFHAQTAVEAAIALHEQVKGKFDAINRIELTTHESAIRIISKVGPLHNFADRDHCLQYMVAIGLMNGTLTADDYTDEAAKNPLIDTLRDKMKVAEDKQYSVDYMAADKRSIANAIQVFFTDGSKTEKVEVHYPVGHRRRRDEGMPLLMEKFRANAATQFAPDVVESIIAASGNMVLPVEAFNDLMRK